MNEIQYRTITTLKETEKSSVVLAAMEGCDDPVIVKRMQNANPEVYRMLSKVDSVHIPHIIAWEQQEKVLVVAEEYVDGETLQFHLDKGTFTEEQKLSLALQLCEAVEVLHNCEPQIIHRDIKPSNILVTEDGVLKLIDFDASRQYKKLSDDSDTRILGTADYAAPEQFGYKQTDVRSDIYSMGIVLEMLDFKATGPAALVWRRMLDTCTNFDPKKRYKSVNILEKVIRGSIRWYKYQWCVVCAVCIALIVSMGMILFGSHVENTGKQVDSQLLSITPEPTVVESTVLTITPILEVAEQLKLIERDLEARFLYVNDYHLGKNEGQAFLVYSSMFEQIENVNWICLTDLLSGEQRYLSKEEYGFENSILYLKDDFMQKLRSTYYKIHIEYTMGEESVSMGTYIRVYAAEEPFSEGQYALQGNYLDYYYEEYGILHAVLRMDATVKISAVYVNRDMEVPKEQYKLLYDGKAIELSAELLEQCKSKEKTEFEIEFDNGKREVLTVANPYLQQ
ncbi:MAG: serine/threonine protein kinase [Lachnospiraceae bacterium]|nr:serine/threonine protein kinase [Lachnospiraceae bacterium]